MIGIKLFSSQRAALRVSCLIFAVSAVRSSALAGGPADLNRDRAVDLRDFAILQNAATGANLPQTAQQFQVARIDGDVDVDAADFAALLPCFNGPGVAVGANCTPQGGYYFPRASVWYQDISFAPVDAESTAVISWLSSAGGFGGGRMQIDFSINVLHADATTPVRTFMPTDDFYTPDCDHVPMPVPVGGALEGEDGFECLGDGDCHLIVADHATNRLYEMWRANIVEPDFYGGCLSVWDMTRVYTPAGRGENCTSADAAGFPIAPLLFSADEVQAGWIDHAIRFILPNSRIRRRVYVHPATHSTNATTGAATAPPYGARLRLRADFPLSSLPNEGARVVARAMQRYGIILADAGTIALTAQSDRFTAADWSGLLGPLDLRSIQVTDFQMIEAGTRYGYTGDCERLPAIESPPAERRPATSDAKESGFDGCTADFE